MLNTFCKDAFWDSNLTWGNHRDYPEFTECFEDTVLLCFASVWLGLSAPIYIYVLMQLKTEPLPRSLKSLSKESIAVFQLSIKYLELSTLVRNLDEENKSYWNSRFVGLAGEGLSLLLVMFYVELERRKKFVTSGILSIYWLLASVCGSVLVYSRMVRQGFDASSTETSMLNSYLVLTFVQLILSCFAEELPKQTGKQDCPLQRSSFLSRCFFSWMGGVLNVGYQKNFTDDDFPRVMPTEQSAIANSHFERLWKQEEEKQKENFMRNGDKDSKVKVSLLKVLVKSYGLSLISCNLLKVVFNAVLFLGPVILGNLIGFAEDHNQPKWKGYVYLVAFVVCLLIENLTIQYLCHLSISIAFRVRTALFNTIFKKSLTMTNKARTESTVGEIVNLLSNDVESIKHWVAFFWLIWSCPAQVLLGFGFLYNTVGMAVFSGAAVMLLVLPINTYLAKHGLQRHRDRMDVKDSRIKLMTEILNGIKILKLYAWEMAFGKKIDDLRSKELSILKNQRLIGMIGSLAWRITPFMIALATFGTYVYISEDHALDAKTAFSSMVVFGIMNGAFAGTPHIISHMMKAYVSLKRVQKFLNNDDIDEDNITNFPSADAISIKNGTFLWNENLGACLKGIDLTIPKGSLVAVVGTVGSGKSSLLSAILGEMEKQEGEINVDGNFAYVPQQAWIQNETLQNNILFGNKLRQSTYEDVIDACELKTDLKILPGADQTEIGEKGINLSGGQKQRVSMARAVYYNADIYLLDDPLSAVDAHVGKSIFDHVIGEKGLLRNKTRVLVTHGITWLQKCDTIVAMEEGAITEIGSYKDLMTRNGAFAKFIQEYSQDGKASENVEDDSIEVTHAPKVPRDTDIQLELSGISSVDSVMRGDSSSKIMAFQNLMVDSGYSSAYDFSDNEIRSRSNSEVSKSKRYLRRSISRALSYEDKHLDDDADYDDMKKKLIRLPSFDNTKKLTEKRIKRETEKIESGKLMEEEEMEDGKVEWKYIEPYFGALGIFSCVMILVFYVSERVSTTGKDICLREWTDNNDLHNLTAMPSNSDERQSMNYYYVGIYALFGFINALMMLFKETMLAYGIVRAAKCIHQKMLHNTFRGSMSFFDTTPVGRIVNRFSQDMEKLDGEISGQFEGFASCILDLVTIVIVVLITVPQFAIVIIPVAGMFQLLKIYFVPTRRQLSRIESKKRSPIFGHFSECLNGTQIIRAYNSQARFAQESADKVDSLQEVLFLQRTIEKWLDVRLNLVNIVSFCTIAFFTIMGRDYLSGAVVGFVFQYALDMSGSLHGLVRLTSELEHSMVAMERIGQYSTRKTEAPLHTSVKPAKDWPRSGNVEMSNYSVRYRDGLDLVLKDINVSVKPGEKIGIVGRTGAGKSSLTLALFRLIEPATGSIDIDGHDISDLGLFDLRSNLTILPQEPVLFSGSLRTNLDPLDDHTDEAIYTALEHAHLKTFIESLPDKLNYECGEGGQNLSVGQRQLICLARSLLRKSKVLVLDEATAAVDMKTDELIQNTIKSEFKECTVLTIAHRLNTIIDYDRILVLAQGEVKEFDKPKTLLKDTNSVFYSMAKDAGLVK